MTKRRSRGDGGLHWDDKRQRWIATASLGFVPDGKRIVKRGSGKTKSEAKAKLKEVLRDYEDGLAIAPRATTCGTSCEGVVDRCGTGSQANRLPDRERCRDRKGPRRGPADSQAG
ncbi:Arm DNA-binding domain-containing protein [Nonomuraea sp. NPDC050536]|uniref:Arm DNA-binding domain-containing protein n=1 Tax=Nonomuraea sp. NPDC050536 TaxID=3364366 RepID=UPI0037C51C67